MSRKLTFFSSIFVSSPGSLKFLNRSEGYLNRAKRNYSVLNKKYANVNRSSVKYGRILIISDIICDLSQALMYLSGITLCCHVALSKDKNPDDVLETEVYRSTWFLTIISKLYQGECSYNLSLFYSL